MGNYCSILKFDDSFDISQVFSRKMSAGALRENMLSKVLICTGICFVNLENCSIMESYIFSDP
jgi:hypothetical protein